MPNFEIQEYTTGFESGVYITTLKHLGSDLVDYIPTPVSGFVDIPQGPGLRVNLLEGAAKIRAPLVLPITVRSHYDGFIVDQ